jgi:hypothetical protein
MKKVKSRQAPAKATRRRAIPVPVAGKTVASAPSGAIRKAKRAAKSKAAAKARKATKPAPRGKPAKGAKVATVVKPTFQVRELDPLRICGGRTSVVKLFRVDEQLVGGKAAGARQVHLVFNDRHGWYCEHGRSCHAVSAVMRHARIR